MHEEHWSMWDSSELQRVKKSSQGRHCLKRTEFGTVVQPQHVAADDEDDDDVPGEDLRDEVCTGDQQTAWAKAQMKGTAKLPLPERVPDHIGMMPAMQIPASKP